MERKDKYASYLMKNQVSLAAKRMRKEYGYCEGCTCEQCCNCQRKERDKEENICIAYDPVMEWNGKEKACGLFNIPFRGLRPKHKPLSRMFPVYPQNPDYQQLTLFQEGR